MLKYTQKELKMKKIKSFSKSFVLLLCAFFLVFGLLLTSNLYTLSNAANSSTPDLSIANTIKVEAFARAEQTLSKVENEEKNMTIYQWQQLQGFTISFDESKLESGKEPPKAEDEKYTMTLNVRYAPLLSEAVPENDEFVIYENVLEPVIADNYTDLESFTFYVDEILTDTFNLLSQGEVEISTQGWGLYQFIIDINGAQSTSNYIAVDPNHLEEGTTFSIAYEDDYTFSGHNAYKFYVVGATSDELKYVRKDYFVWYVYGKDFSNKNYVLTAADATGEYAGYDSLYSTVERTGDTFYFDDNGVAGNWNVYCVYQDDFNGAEITSTQSHAVMTGDVIEPGTIVWIVVGISVAVLAIVIVVIVVSVKKEKVW